jgi:tetratricopeptide (TPR) repeat protein
MCRRRIENGPITTPIFSAPFASTFRKNGKSAGDPVITIRYRKGATLTTSLLQRAYAAAAKFNWPHAETLWSEARKEHPWLADGWVQGVTALNRLGRKADALTMLEQTEARFPGNPGVRTFAAHQAMEREDWPRAEALWQSARKHSPQLADGWLHGASALRRLERNAEADGLMDQAFLHFPQHKGVQVFFAYDSMRMGRLERALELWSCVLSRHPDDREAQRQHNTVVSDIRNLALGSDQPMGAAEIFVGPDDETARASRDVMLRFQSLGPNCEFGLVQRRFNAEPLGLFRWAAIPIASLASSIASGLAAFHTPDDALLATHYLPTEYYLDLPTIGFSMHTHVSQSEDAGRLLQPMKRRLRRLREKMLEDMADGDVIFLRKAEVDDMPLSDMIGLHDALRQHGPCRLLCVCLDKGALVGKVFLIKDGLAIGYLHQFWNLADSDEGWRLLCTQAAELFDAEALLNQVTVVAPTAACSNNNSF